MDFYVAPKMLRTCEYANTYILKSPQTTRIENQQCGKIWKKYTATTNKRTCAESNVTMHCICVWKVRATALCFSQTIWKLFIFCTKYPVSVTSVMHLFNDLLI